MNLLLSLVVIVLGVVALALGILFIYEGISKINYLTENVKGRKSR
jgi:hypothetical protein